MSAGRPCQLLSELFSVGVFSVLWSPFLQTPPFGVFASLVNGGAEMRSFRTRVRPLFRREDQARRKYEQVYRLRGHGKSMISGPQIFPLPEGSSRDTASCAVLSHELFSFPYFSSLFLFFVFHWPGLGWPTTIAETFSLLVILFRTRLTDRSDFSLRSRKRFTDCSAEFGSMNFFGCAVGIFLQQKVFGRISAPLARQLMHFSIYAFLKAVLLR